MFIAIISLGKKDDTSVILIQLPFFFWLQLEFVFDGKSAKVDKLGHWLCMTFSVMYQKCL